MDISLLVLIVLLSLAVFFAYRKGGLPTVLLGLKQTRNTFKSMWIRILLGITLGGFIQVLIPSALIAEWLGPASGIKGILIGAYVGVFGGGGPYVMLPIIVAIYQAGAGEGPIIALLTGQMLGIQNLLTWQIPLLGSRIALSRYIACLLVPPLVGLAGGAIYQLMGFS